MKEDFSEIDLKYESLLQESAELDGVIEQAFDELLSVFTDHYPILEKVSILKLNVEDLNIWIQTRLGNSEQ